MAEAYIAIANGSPWVVPSLESISPSPTIKSLIGAWYVLLSMVDIAGHMTWMLWRAACLFMALKTFEASTSRIASVWSNVKISLIACTAASHPASCPAQVCKGPAAACISSLTVFSTALAIICRGTSPIPIGLHPELLFIGGLIDRPQK